MKRSEFEISNYLKDDRLSIHGTVSIVQTRFEEDKRYVIPVPPSDMIQNLKGLLESEVGSDITFHIGSEEFRAHKSILAARSRVFKAMFYGLVGNPDMKTVVIEEFDPFAFKAMLLFLYSDELPEAHELFDSESVCTSTTLMRHMLAAADRFDLARLKLMCEAKLYEDIAANTVVDTLSLAERYQCPELKTACLNFAAKSENLGATPNTVPASTGIFCQFQYLKIIMAPTAAKRPRVSESEMSSSQLFYDTVQVGGYDWKIRFYPDGANQASKEYISVYIELASPGEVTASVKFKLLDQCREGQFFSNTTSLYTFKEGGDREFSKYMKRSEFETSNYLKDDRLSIHGTVSTVQTRFEEDKPYVISIPQSDMVQNIKGLLKSEIGSDVTFQVANKEFRAHKSILAARPPVFRAMFFGLVGNPYMQTVVIEEFDPFTFKIIMAPNAAKRQRVSKSEMSSSQLFYETVKGSHEFKINGYSHAKGMGIGKYNSSAKFRVAGYDWKIRFCPDGDDQASEEYISVFAKLLGSPGQVRASFEFNLLNQNGKDHWRLVSQCPRTFIAGSSSRYFLLNLGISVLIICIFLIEVAEMENQIDVCTLNFFFFVCFTLQFCKKDLLLGFSQYMKRSELETSDYLKDDCLIIHWGNYVIPVPPSDMAGNLKGLLQSEIGSDITFQVGNEFFRTHKSILAARSPAMLLFLYSDELPEAHELSDSDSPCTSTTIMQHLLAAADHYNLARLKLMCEAKLCEGTTAGTMADTLALAERHQCLQLKTASLKFAAKPENIGEVIKSDGYAHLEKWCPSLLTDLLMTNAVVDKK
ncbi:hypothetical protein MKX03_009815 [Papaver bracteatum]|nr:hypothetical protein MKX03_009815 [Papaver bracteatum]